MVNFLDKLIGLLETSNVELIVFFNGAIEPQRMNEWITQQKEEYKKVNQVSVFEYYLLYAEGDWLCSFLS